MLNMYETIQSIPNDFGLTSCKLVRKHFAQHFYNAYDTKHSQIYDSFVPDGS